jgi:hypothetical protein
VGHSASRLTEEREGEREERIRCHLGSSSLQRRRLPVACRYYSDPTWARGATEPTSVGVTDKIAAAGRTRRRRMDFSSLPCVRVHLLLQPADEPWGAERGVRLARAAEQHTAADFFENPALAKLCVDFLHGDAPCTATVGHCSVIARAASDHGSTQAGCVRSSTGGTCCACRCWAVFFFLATPTSSSVRGLVCLRH